MRYFSLVNNTQYTISYLYLYHSGHSFSVHRIITVTVNSKEHWSFSVIRHFLVNPGRFLQILTCSGCDPIVC